MMARYAFVIGQGFHFILTCRLHIEGVDVVSARTPVERTRALIKCQACRFFTESLDLLHEQLGLGFGDEHLIQPSFHIGNNLIRLGNVCGFALRRLRIIELRVFLHELEKCFQVAFKLHLRHDFAHFIMNARNFG